ncbi:hypothetical protein L9F63_013686 [Diploptera punctata]|uniref:DUF4485 domain-containing protein n=1 Tax=Diploptera punctata TaxID=6984 RepID=A0AAD8AAF8_DIPPU|nr:hypothetical protein L9F63_013686 [Diploptera punctata]
MTSQNFVNPISSLNENYCQNYVTALGLINLIPEEDRTRIKLWLKKLNKMEGGPEELTIRNDYMWFLVLMLQNQHITMPFDELPPAGMLRPLQRILPSRVYKEVLMTCNQNSAWVDEIPGDEDKSQGEEKPQEPPVPPSQFFMTQPIPKSGVICYMGVFSARHHD